MFVDKNVEKLFDAIYEGEESAKLANEMKGRQFAFQYGIVSNNNDPEKKGRVKVTTDHVGQKVETQWLIRYLPFPFFDPPIPTIGHGVIVGFQDADPHSGFYVGVAMNFPNPELPKKNRITDYAEYIVGEKVVHVEEDCKITTEQNYNLNAELDINLNSDLDTKITSKQHCDIEAEGRFLAKNGAGASIELVEKAGKVLIKAPSGGSYTFMLGNQTILDIDGTNGEFTWDLAGRAMRFINASTVSINGKEVITIGSVDDEGNVNVTRGY